MCIVVLIKITKSYPMFFDVWMNILKAVDGSVLLLAHTNQMAVTNLKKRHLKEKLIQAELFSQVI